MHRLLQLCRFCAHSPVLCCLLSGPMPLTPTAPCPLPVSAACACVLVCLCPSVPCRLAGGQHQGGAPGGAAAQHRRVPAAGQRRHAALCGVHGGQADAGLRLRPPDLRQVRGQDYGLSLLQARHHRQNKALRVSRSRRHLGRPRSWVSARLPAFGCCLTGVCDSFLPVIHVWRLLAICPCVLVCEALPRCALALCCQPQWVNMTCVQAAWAAAQARSW